MKVKFREGPCLQRAVYPPRDAQCLQGASSPKTFISKSLYEKGKLLPGAVRRYPTWVPAKLGPRPGEMCTCFLLLLYQTDHKRSGLNPRMRSCSSRVQTQQRVSLGCEPLHRAGRSSQLQPVQTPDRPNPLSTPCCAPVLLWLIHPTWPGAPPQRSQSLGNQPSGHCPHKSPLTV